MRCFKKNLVAVGMLLSLPVFANASENRFQFEKTADGYIRFDGNTGSIDVCKLNNNQIDCAITPDERAGYEAKINKLEAELLDNKSKEQQQNLSRLPSKKDMDDTFDAMKYFLDKFKDSFSEEQDDKQPSSGHL